MSVRIGVGDVVGVDVRVGPLLVHHVGVVVEDSLRGIRVVSNSKRAGRVAEESLEAFAEGGVVAAHPHIRGGLTPDGVARRARSAIGRPYDLFAGNCEHFVRWAHAVPAESPQINQAVGGLVLLGLIALAFRAASDQRSA